MSKTTRRISVAVMTVSLAATTAFGVIKANSVYDDSNIGISSVLDRYVESVQLDTTEDTISAKNRQRQRQLIRRIARRQQKRIKQYLHRRKK